MDQDFVKLYSSEDHENYLQKEFKNMFSSKNYQDTKFVCSDGDLSVNKMMAGLVLPELAQSQRFNSFQGELIVLLPQHDLAEVKRLIDKLFTFKNEGAYFQNYNVETKASFQEKDIKEENSADTYVEEMAVCDDLEEYSDDENFIQDDNNEENLHLSNGNDLTISEESDYKKSNSATRLRNKRLVEFLKVCEAIFGREIFTMNENLVTCLECSEILNIPNGHMDLKRHLRTNHKAIHSEFMLQNKERNVKIRQGILVVPKNVKHEKWSLVWDYFIQDDANECAICTACSSEIPNKGGVRAATRHLQSQHKNRFAEFIAKRNENKIVDTKVEAVEQEENGYICDICGKPMGSKSSLTNHRRNSHNPHHGTYKCDVCEKFYSTPNQLANHKKSQHEGHNVFPCEQCGKILSSQVNLNMHIKTVHDKIKDIKCPHCDYYISSRNSLYVHIKEAHLGIKFPCDQCDSVFSKYSTLHSHKLVHSENRPFVCQQCGKGFKQKTKLKTHTLNLHSTSTFSCEDCGKSFKSEQYLQDHMRMHDESSQFPCTYCEKKFVSKTKLKHHTNIHTGERPYVCQRACGKSFRTSDQRAHHKKQCSAFLA